MKLPTNLTQTEVLDIIERVVTLLAPSFKFGYFDAEDMKQQARMFAIQALDKYDESRPLPNFLYRHIRNRLINFKRDNFRRTEPPCKPCYMADTDGIASSHTNGAFCKRHIQWKKRNHSKQNLMNPLDIGNINDEHETNTRTESSVVNNAEINEILEKIDRLLPAELRNIYLQMREGLSVTKSKRLEVEEYIKEIMNEREEE